MSKGLWDVDWMRCGCCGGAIGVSSSLCCCAAYVVWGYCMVVVGSRKHGKCWSTWRGERCHA
jgi:hypothetical protein